MFLLSNSDIANPQFQSALSQLNATRFPVKTAWNISRLMKQIDKARKEMQEPYVNVLKNHCVLTENGDLAPQKTKPVVDEEGNVTKEAQEMPDTYQVKPECEEAFKKEMEEFMSIQSEIQSYKVKLDELVDRTGKPVEFAGSILGLLEPIIDDVKSLSLA